MRRLLLALCVLALTLPVYGEVEYTSAYDPAFVRRVASLDPLRYMAFPLRLDVSCSTAFNACNASAGAAGVGATSNTAWTGTNSFLDSNFSILDNSDPTKIAKFEASGISAGTTRTYTLFNASGTIPLLSSTNAWTGANTFTTTSTFNAQLIMGPDIYIALGADALSSNTVLQAIGNTPDTGYLGTGTLGNSWIIGETQDRAFNFAHPLSTFPIVHFHSQNQSTTEFGSIAHDATDFRLSSGAGAINLAPAGHVKMTGTAPAVTANCGTSPSVLGSDMAGKLNVGTGGSATTCTLTFAVAYTVAPACVANNETTTQLIRATSTTTTLVLTAAAAFTASDIISYICIQGS